MSRVGEGIAGGMAATLVVHPTLAIRAATTLPDYRATHRAARRVGERQYEFQQPLSRQRRGLPAARKNNRGRARKTLLVGHGPVLAAPRRAFGARGHGARARTAGCERPLII